VIAPRPPIGPNLEAARKAHAYDAVYIALAEALDVSLVTADRPTG
jgi:predicted nucleic acid-binding protein